MIAKVNSMRQEYIDIAKGLGILCVVYGHTFGFDEFGNFVYLFHMPLFFILSGAFLGMRKGVVGEVYNKTKRLLIPYVIFTVVAFPIQIYKDIEGIEMLSGGARFW